MTRCHPTLAAIGAALLLAGSLLLAAPGPAGAGVAPDLVGNDGNTLILFNSGAPAGTRTTVAVQAPAGTTLLGIDTRPSTQVIFGVFQAADGSLSVGTVSHTDGAVGSLIPLTNTAGGGPILLSEFFEIGIDFNPAADRLRFTTDQGDNVRINVDDGPTTVDTNLSEIDSTGGEDVVIAIAYTNNTIQVPASTELFDVVSPGDDDDLLAEQGDQPPGPNGGVLTPVGTDLGLDGVVDDGGFEITSAGVPFAALTTFEFDQVERHARTKAGGPPADTRLFTIDVATGVATLVDLIGTGDDEFRSLTSIPVQLPATSTTTTAPTTSTTLAATSTTVRVLARTGDQEAGQGLLGIALIAAGGAALVTATRLRARRS